jgi:hypothetical protein
MRLKVQRRESSRKDIISLPIPYNINNIPTYVMTLERGGEVKMFAMVAI